MECAPFTFVRQQHLQHHPIWFTVRGGEEAEAEIEIETAAPSQDSALEQLNNVNENDDSKVVESLEEATGVVDVNIDDGNIDGHGAVQENSFKNMGINTDSLVFQACQPGDGSQTDPDGIPERFLRMQKGNREKAKAAFAHTIQWREDHEVDTILKRPHPKFDLCKKIFPVYIPGRDQQKHIVVVQRVGLIDIEYGAKNNVSGDDLLMHYIYIIEYCWNILDPEPFGVMTTVMDLKGVRLKTFRDGNIRGFLRKFVAAMSENYPNRSHKTLIINAPAWINAAYNLVKPLLRSSTREKISIMNGGKKQDALMVEILGAEHVPRELLNDPSILDDDDDDDEHIESGHVHVLSEIELDMRELCLASLEKNDVKMLLES